ncbi:hypothetical protein AFLA_011410 [Aspergillus flavus NRRL3357]|nr:hypothetical protein AFLA_011410 [Aspergillus flavus NRRL3357]
MGLAYAESASPRSKHDRKLTSLTAIYIFPDYWSRQTSLSTFTVLFNLRRTLQADHNTTDHQLDDLVFDQRDTT